MATGQLDGLWLPLGDVGDGGRRMTPMEVLRVATGMARTPSASSSDLGSLEPAKLRRDLIAVDANPLGIYTTRYTVRYVMKNGRLYEGNTLNEVCLPTTVAENVVVGGTEPAKAREFALGPATTRPGDGAAGFRVSAGQPLTQDGARGTFASLQGLCFRACIVDLLLA